MKRADCALNCGGPRKRWPTRTWPWRWNKPSWGWPVRKWTRAWKPLKKSTVASGARGGLGQAGVESDPALPTREHDGPKLLCAPKGLAAADRGAGLAAGTGAGGARA